MTAMDWTGANCLQVDPETMQPEEATPEQVEQAEAVCRGCYLFAQCAEWALSQEGTDPETGARLGAYGVHAGRWWGEPPRVPSIECAGCGARVEQQRTGRRLYCGPVCRNRAHRSRRLSA